MRRRSLLRRLLLWTINLLLLLPLLAVAGALLWLRSDQALNLVRDTASEVLAEQGFKLRLGAVAGPLPQALQLTDIEVGDAGGPFLRAKGLNIELRLVALLSGRLEIAALRLEEPEILGLPQSAADKDPAAADTSADIKSMAAPPLDIVLANLEVADGRISGELLTALAGQAEADGQIPPALTFSLSGQAALRGEAFSAALKATALTTGASGSLEADLAASLADLPAASFNARLEAVLEDIAALAGPAASGALSASVTASGPVAAPQISLKAQSKEIRLADGGALSGPALQGQAALRLPLLAPDNASGAGRFEISLTDSPGGPLQASTAWRFEMPGPELSDKNASLPPTFDEAPGLPPRIQPGGNDFPRTPSSADPLLLALSDLELHGAGLDVTGSVQALIYDSQAAPPALSGSLAVNVGDWRSLGALAGLKLEGEAARLDISLKDQPGQEAHLTLDLPRLEMLPEGPDQGPPTAVLRQTRLQADLRDLFGAPDLQVFFESGAGEAAFLTWQAGRGQVTGKALKGDFSLALDGQSPWRGQSLADKKESGPDAQASVKARPPAQIQAQRQPPAQTPASILTLAGAYDLDAAAGPLLRLDALGLRDPRAGAGLSLKQALQLSFKDGLSAKGLDLAFEPSGSLTGEAALTPQGMLLKAELSSLPLAFFNLFGLSDLPKGEISAKADLGAASGAPAGDLSFSARLGGEQKNDALPLFELDLSARLTTQAGHPQLAGQGSFGSALAKEAPKGQLSFRLPLTMADGGPPLPDMKAPLAASLRWRGPLESLWPALPLPDTALGGALMLEADVSGSADAPRAGFTAYMAGGRFTDVGNGLYIGGIDLEAAGSYADKEGADLHLVLAANDQQSGHLAAEADLKGLGGDAPLIALRAQLASFSPLQRDDLNITLSGHCGVNGALDGAVISGIILAEQGEFVISPSLADSMALLEVEDKDGGKSKATKNGQENEAAKSGQDQPKGAKAKAPNDAPNDAANDAHTEAPGPDLDLRLSVPRHFFIRGMGVDSEWKGDLRVTGKASAPVLRGSLAPVRGSMDILARTFRFSGGDIRFDGNPKPDPVLNLVLSYENPDITALVRVGGSAQKPRFALDSEPPLPQDEILAHVLFGKSATELSRFEAIQLADSLRGLSSGGGALSGFMGDIRKNTGLDMLRLGASKESDRRSSSGLSGEGELGPQQARSETSENGGETDAPSLEAGKYINDSIYIGIEQGLGPDSAAVRVEVEILPRLTLEGKSASEAGEVGIGWKLDY